MTDSLRRVRQAAAGTSVPVLQGRRAAALTRGASRREGKSQETQGKILDAAEELFATHGLYGVTLRDIAGSAGVDTALLHYYFDSKDSIFRAVVARRGVTLSEDIARELDALEMDGDLTLEKLVAAYVRPVFRFNRTGGVGWRNYCAITLRLSNSPDWASDVIAEQFDPIALRLIGLLRKAMPEAEEANLYWAHQMFGRVMTITNAPKGRLERLSKGLCDANDFDLMEPLIVKFAVAGIRGMCGK